ncbi:MAG: tetratricopeptide repeat protein [Selenomonadaceae bacterium]|nr:tetratricopeptide repeat protein [Selenomonadaceae bacterium]MBR1806832.1 tetratricopeptide repeat protein [Selenomonadaceae bacterium]
MKKFLAAFLAAGTLLFASNVNAEIRVYEGTDEYIMSEFETPDVAKQRAKQKAERMAIEKAGVFIESTTEVANMMVTKDEIITMTGGILKLVENPTYQMIPLENGETFRVRATVKAQIDTDDITKWLNRGAGERSEIVKQNQELQRAIDEQDRQIAELKSKLANAGSAQDREKISEQFAAEDKTFMANQKLQDALKFYYAGNLNGAMNACTESLSLNSNSTLAYSLRGTIYYQLGQYQNAISDLSQAAAFNSSDEKIFYNRALAHIKLQNYRAAVEDFTVAIQINPNDADAYYNRALCWQRLGNFVQYNSDMAKARSLGH